MPVLSLTDVTKQYPGTPVPALAGLNLDVQEGEILSVTGESGSGKTTLLRVIAGLETPDRGRIVIHGKEVCGPGRPQVVPEARGVGMVFQNYALFPHLTIRENVLYGLRKPKSRADRESILASVLGLTGLCGFEKRYPHEVSGGQQQRVALARALAPQPRIILLDEPFSNLDVTLRQQLREDIGRILRAARTTALLVTHDTRDALAISDRIAVMKHGQLQQLGDPREIYGHPVNEMTAILFGRMNFLPPGSMGHPIAEGPVWIRPEQLEILPAGSPPPADSLHPAPSGTSPPLHLKGTVVRTHFYGDRQEVVVAWDSPHGNTLEITVLGHAWNEYKSGSPVQLREKAGAPASGQIVSPGVFS